MGTQNEDTDIIPTPKLSKKVILKVVTKKNGTFKAIREKGKKNFVKVTSKLELEKEKVH